MSLSGIFSIFRENSMLQRLLQQAPTHMRYCCGNLLRNIVNAQMEHAHSGVASTAPKKWIVEIPYQAEHHPYSEPREHCIDDQLF